MKNVTTPIGIRKVCATGAPTISAVLDLIVSALLLSLPVLLISSELRNNPFTVVPFVIAPWVYALLAHKGKLPSFGNWTLGIKRYSYSEITEYSGTGALFVNVELTSKLHMIRVIAFVLLIVGLISVLEIIGGNYAT